MELTAEHAAQLAEQRKGVRRARGQGRRWYLRAVLMLVIGWWAFWRGGSFNLTLGITMAALATLAISLGRSLRRQADTAERKIELMERSGGRAAADQRTSAPADQRTEGP